MPASDRWERLTDWKEVQAVEERSLMALAGVVGVGIGVRRRNGRWTGEPCLTVFVERKRRIEDLAPEDRVPRRVGPAGQLPTDVVESGRFQAASLPGPEGDCPDGDKVYRCRVRPAGAGYSLGHAGLYYKKTPLAGSITAAVYDAEGKAYLLSNNHVLAMLNQKKPGSPIVQPGPADGGTVAKRKPAEGAQIGVLARYVPLKFGETDVNKVDAALAACDRKDVKQGPPAVAEVSPGDRVRMIGRTSGEVSTTVIAVNVTTGMEYLTGKTAQLYEQIATGPMSKMCDSGALLCDERGYAAGMLVGVSEYWGKGRGRGSIFSTMANALKELNVSLRPLGG